MLTLLFYEKLLGVWCKWLRQNSRDSFYAYYHECRRNKKWFVVLSCMLCCSVSPVFVWKYFYIKPSNMDTQRVCWSIAGFHARQGWMLRTIFLFLLNSQSNKSVGARLTHWRLKNSTWLSLVHFIEVITSLLLSLSWETSNKVTRKILKPRERWEAGNRKFWLRLHLRHWISFRDEMFSQESNAAGNIIRTLHVLSSTDNNFHEHINRLHIAPKFISFYRVLGVY